MTPTPQAAKEFKLLLEEARTLANFSNLDSEDKADYFRNNYPEVVPRFVWAGHEIAFDSGPQGQRSSSAWTRVREEVRRAWIDRFPPAQCLELIAEIVDMDRLDQVMNFSQEQLSTFEQYGIKAKFALPQPRIYPYQRAVMFLAVNPWRAKFCAVCRGRFVAAEPKQRLCSESCRQMAQAN